MIRPTVRELVSSGVSPRLAEILACGRPPGIHGDDTTAFAGFGSLKKQLGRDFDRVTKAARKNGYSPGSHDVYNPTFARYEGDPRAFVSQGEGLGKYRKMAEQSGLGCDGDISVSVTREPSEKPKRKRLAKDLIAQHITKRVAENPDLLHAGPKKREDLVQSIIHKHGNKS